MKQTKHINWNASVAMPSHLHATIRLFPLLSALIFLAAVTPVLLQASLIDIEASRQSFVLQSKKIDIPGYPNAFNPSAVRFQGKIYMSFRVMLPEPRSASHSDFGSRIGIIELNHDLSPAGAPRLLDFRCLFKEEGISANAEDARLIVVQDKLHLIYSDTVDANCEWGSWRCFVAELDLTVDSIQIVSSEPIKLFPGASPSRREKNWVPFVYEGHLLLSYSIAPHRVFFYLHGNEACEEIFSSTPDVYWPLGELRGGTPAEQIDEDRYLAFFHSSCPLATTHSGGKTIPHYFFGAYTFSSKPPFHLLALSPDPIVGQNFYTSPDYEPYWHPVRVVFPCGFLTEESHFWVFFGKQDHECWAVKMDKQGLLKSLHPLQ